MCVRVCFNGFIFTCCIQEENIHISVKGGRLKVHNMNVKIVLLDNTEGYALVEGHV